MELQQTASKGFVLDPKKEQRQFLNPNEILEEIGLMGQMTFADFGCGAGYFTIPAAKMVGDHGKVYAVDILKEVFPVYTHQLIPLPPQNSDSASFSLQQTGALGLAGQSSLSPLPDAPESFARSI